MRYWLREAREAAGLTQKELGTLVGKDVTTIGKYENGTRNPSAHTAQKIASVLRLDWTMFFPEDILVPENHEGMHALTEKVS